MKSNIKYQYTPLCLFDNRDFRECLLNAVKTELQPEWTLEKFESSLNGGDVAFKASYKSADGINSWTTVRGDGHVGDSSSFDNYIYAKDFARYNYSEEPLGDVLITCTLVLDKNSVVDPSSPVQ
jgi:hypothetical protein